MAESESGQERSEEPTEKKLNDAKKKGQIARSRDFNTMVIIALAATALIMMGQQIVSDLSDIMTQFFQPSRADVFDPKGALRWFYAAMLDGVWLLMPFLALMLAGALFAPISIGGWAFSLESITPKLSKLNPLKGLKKILSVKSLVELAKTMGKFILVAAISLVIIWNNVDEYLQLGGMPMRAALVKASELLTWAFLLVTIALMIIAGIDVPFQIWNHKKEMKMTLQEVKDEMKDTEGKPEVKAKIRQTQREMAEARMMSAVPDADVVVTNPTHFAIALKYDPDNMRAPMVLAKGADFVAANIRQVANANNILLLETPPLARALYHTTEIGREIPEGLYVAVAQILAYVFQLRDVQKNGGEKPTRPEPEIPEAFKKFINMPSDAPLNE
ncbi:Flagellar biosynthesis protein FlhB [hydrothermal vent metagenome]|uniref:Flagellar biosynthetic protein FlhB n=1 Tax=hydrothermal vent metagenome TaxID=652676 RepID=A0A3B0X5W0_9ZZZZ